MLRRITVNAAAKGASTKAAAPAKTLRAINITKSNLVDSQGGSATRNVDGIIYTLSYASDADKITVVDRVNRMEYDVEVGAKDNRISIVLESGRALAGAAPSFEQYQAVLKASSVGAELLNGRAAMVAFLGIAGVELATGQTFISQLTSGTGAAAAVGLAVFTMAASLAPAVAGKVKVEDVFPDANSSYADRQLPYYFSPLAEIINSRVAMLGLAALVINEVIRGVPVF